jgi:hypothetical protein
MARKPDCSKMEKPKVTEKRVSERTNFVADWGCGSMPKKRIRVPRPETCGTDTALGKLRGDIQQAGI